MDRSHGLRSLQDLLAAETGLDLAGWTLEEASGISADGLTIVGNGENPAGLPEAWIIRLDPADHQVDQILPLAFVLEENYPNPFNGAGVLGGAALLAGGWSALVEKATASTAGRAGGYPGPWFEASIPQLQSLISKGALSSSELTRLYLNQIAGLNPLLHAIIETNPDALAIAAQLDNERRKGQVRGPLHGIPIVEWQACWNLYLRRPLTGTETHRLRLRPRTGAQAAARAAAVPQRRASGASRRRPLQHPGGQGSSPGRLGCLRKPSQHGQTRVPLSVNH